LRRILLVVWVLIVGFAAAVFGLANAGAVLSEDSTAPLTCPPPGPPFSLWGYVTLNGAAASGLAAWVNDV
jgi:hypothetical protein